MEAERFNDLLLRISEGDESAFKEIYEKYSGAIKWAAFSVIRVWEETEYILNEVLIKIWEKSGSTTSNPDAWIFKIAKNCARDYCRKNSIQLKHTVPIDSIIESRAVSSEDTYGNVVFRSMISGLSDIDQEIVIRKILFHYTHSEIAKEMRMPLGTVLWRYHRSLRKLKGELTKESGK